MVQQLDTPDWGQSVQQVANHRPVGFFAGAPFSSGIVHVLAAVPGHRWVLLGIYVDSEPSLDFAYQVQTTDAAAVYIVGHPYQAGGRYYNLNGWVVPVGLGIDAKVLFPQNANQIMVSVSVSRV
ncbi:MAG: hypothetical protein ACRDOE_00270 [Streptosporangiaceae bacterium]